MTSLEPAECERFEYDKDDDGCWKKCQKYWEEHKKRCIIALVTLVVVVVLGLGLGLRHGSDATGPQTTTLTLTGNTITTTTTAASTTTTTINKALFVGPGLFWTNKSEIILLPPQSSNCSTPDFPVARIHSYVMFSSTSGVQLCGGSAGSTYYSDCYELPFGGKNWEKQRPLIKKRSGAATTTFGDEIIISGGSDNGDRALETTEIRRDDGSWQSFVVDLPEPTFRPCMVAINASQIILVGGINDDDEVISTVYLLDKTNIGEGWQQKPSLKTKRKYHSCSLVYDSDQNPFVVVAGGVNGGYLDSSELFDLRTETWSEGPKLPKATNGAKMIGPYHIGGSETYMDILKIEKFSSGWQWTLVGNLKYGKHSFDAVEIQLTSECNGWT